jgi:hypothetical protein
VLHINREVIHHLAEVCLIRDLHRLTGGHIGRNTDRPTDRQTRQEAS